MENGFSFDEEEIQCIYRSPFWPLGDPKLRKTFYKHTLYVKLQSSNEIVSRTILDYDQSDVIQAPTFVITPESGEATTWGTFNWNDSIWSATISSVYPDQIVGSGFTVAIEYTESSTKAPFTLDTIILEYRTNDRK
jgi:hypothetical protein